MEDPNKFNIKNIKLLKDFVIEIQYEEGKIQVIDFGTITRKGWWDNLKDSTFFNQVKINEVANLEWPNEYEFEPEHLYYWDKFGHHYTHPTDQ